jgi:hypothetical protein
MAFWMLPAAMAGINAIKGSQQRDAARDYNKHQAEVTRYSPWTGMTGQTKQVTGGLLTDAAGGAMQGAMMGQAFGVGGGAPDAGTSAVVSPEYSTDMMQSPWNYMKRKDALQGGMSMMNA